MELIKRCPFYERTKYASIGATIFFTAVLAFISSFFALKLIFDSILLVVFGAFFWAFHIVYISNTNDGYYPDISSILNKLEVDLLQTKRDKAVKEFLDEVKPEYKVFINPNLKI